MLLLFLLQEFSCTHSVSLCFSSGFKSDMLSLMRSRHFRDAKRKHTHEEKVRSVKCWISTCPSSPSNQHLQRRDQSGRKTHEQVVPHRHPSPDPTAPHSSSRYCSSETPAGWPTCASTAVHHLGARRPSGQSALLLPRRQRWRWTSFATGLRSRGGGCDRMPSLDGWA